MKLAIYLLELGRSLVISGASYKVVVDFVIHVTGEKSGKYFKEGRKISLFHREVLMPRNFSI